MAVLADLILVAVLVWLALSVVFLARRRAAAVHRAGWRARTRALPEGGHVVELVCPGEPAQEVARLRADADWDTLGSGLAEALSEAEARAATLNAARRR